MTRLVVKAKKLNIRSVIPTFLPDANNIVGIVKENFAFEGEEVTAVPNPALGKWYKDKDHRFYWGGALAVFEAAPDEQAPQFEKPDNDVLERAVISPLIKRKIEQVINAFETGTADGNYAMLVTYDDYSDPETGRRIKQVTYGRSQTTEFGHLKALVQDYVAHNGLFANELQPFLTHLGRKPSLATDTIFCNALKKAGKSDPVMRTCQDSLFDSKYYLPAYGWFTRNGFTLPLSLLVIYDSYIHSGGILGFLRSKFSTSVPVNGGNEKEWIANYVNARHNWLASHSSQLLRNTKYRTECLKEQLKNSNWDLSQKIIANGVSIA